MILNRPARSFSRYPPTPGSAQREQVKYQTFSLYLGEVCLYTWLLTSLNVGPKGTRKQYSSKMLSKSVGGSHAFSPLTCSRGGTSSPTPLGKRFVHASKTQPAVLWLRDWLLGHLAVELMGSGFTNLPTPQDRWF
jgi:hypothetical protein